MVRPRKTSSETSRSPGRIGSNYIRQLGIGRGAEGFLTEENRATEIHRETPVAAASAFGRRREWRVATGASGHLNSSRLPPPPRATHPREARRQPSLCAFVNSVMKDDRQLPPLKSRLNVSTGEPHRGVTSLL